MIAVKEETGVIAKTLVVSEPTDGGSELEWS